jgi:hypothetical protein
MNSAVQPKANEIQYGGEHYRTEYQHWDFLIDLGYGPSYFIGCATKYLSRYLKKNGLEDLNKAKHFVQKLYEALDADPRSVAMELTNKLSTTHRIELFKMFNEANHLTDKQRSAIGGIISAKSKEDLAAVMVIINDMITEFQNPNTAPVFLPDDPNAHPGFREEGVTGGNVYHYQCVKCRDHIDVVGHVKPSCANNPGCVHRAVPAG